MFSARSGIDRTPNRLSQAIARARQANRSLLDLTASNPTSVELSAHDDALRAALDQPGVARYEPHPLGSPAARAALAADLDHDAGRLLLTSSTSEAYGILFKLLCDPGDEILVPRPSYPLIEHLAGLEQIRVVNYPLRHDGQWHIDVPALREAMTGRTRALLVVNPNNPTGQFVKHDELQAIMDLGLPVISDEVFAPYALGEDPKRCPTLRHVDDVLTFTLNGLSKRAGLPQLKLAWLTANGPADSVTEAMGRLELIADTYLSVATPVQLALPELLALSEPTRQRIMQRLVTNLDRLRDSIGPHSPITLREPEGGWYATLKLPSTQDDEGWALTLLDGPGVLVQPGHFYDFIEDPMLVLSLLTPEDTFAAGLAALHSTVRASIS